ncbi:GerAB/ArcD/ProY family transporter [Tumebacillus permanentifrigoris]|uniref:GerAB/ArcD/ProY family transporter n=1 Tax=Tumebacillus permanentifrigoris TaxID=378543 RepID=UPI0014736AC5|nr:GerAB/ArcD/ProY family transporter [Tumebacillus permanentifrigoris]
MRHSETPAPYAPEHPQHPRNRINGIELMFLLHTVPIGVGVLGMVRFIADKAGHDAPLAVLISGLYPQVGVLFMWLLLKRFRTMGIYEIHQQLFGRWVGKIFNLAFASYCLYAFFMTLRTFTELVNTWLYPMMSPWVLSLIFLVPMIYASYAGIQLLGRYAIMTFFLTSWILVLIYFPIMEGSSSYLLPFGSNGISRIFQGSLLSALSVLGFELLMVYYPFVSYKKDVLPAATIASWSVTLVYLINAVVSIMFFSLPQLSKTIWPMLTMFKHVQVPFIERFETIVIAVWILKVVNTAGTYLWAGVDGMLKTIPVKKWVLYGLILILALVFSNALHTRAEINTQLNFLSKLGLGLMIGYPLLLWLLSLVLRKKGVEPS